MFADGLSCMDLVQQLKAVESILHLAKRTLVQDHMEHCIGDALNEGGITAKHHHEASQPQSLRSAG
jgi:uncharacterized protein